MSCLATAGEMDFSAARSWQQVLENGDMGDIQDSYAAVGKLTDEAGNIDAGRCREEADGLAKALRDNPVGLAVRAAASACASLLSDDAAAERHAQAFAALAREAIRSNADNFGEIPVRVMAEADIQAFIDASGEEPLYLYYTLVNEGTGLNMHVALQNPETGRERSLAFDYMSAQFSVQHAARYADFPIFRMLSVRDTLKTFGNIPGSVASETKALYAALSSPQRDERDTAIESLARQGNFSAVTLYAYDCLTRRLAACESSAVDLLLPWAEAHSAMAMTTLAALQADPAEGRADEKSARTLLDAADRRLGTFNASTRFAALLNARSQGGKLSRFVRKRLQMAADAGNPNAEWLLALREKSFEKRDHALRDKTLAGLVHAADTGLSGAQDMLARERWASGNKAEALRWFNAAAEQGDVDSQRSLAAVFAAGVDVPADSEKARYWHARAANNGNVDSMIWMANLYAGMPASDEGRFQLNGWLRSASAFGNIDASVRLANLFRSGASGLDGGPKEAESLYRTVLKTNDRPDARRGLAELLFGTEGVEKNIDEARELLTADAEKGDDDSQFELAVHWLRGEFGAVGTQAREWLGKAADAGNTKAGNELGILLFYDRDGQGRDARGGMARIESAAEAGHDQARNNLAWMLCTADIASLRDAQRGLGVSKLLNKEVADDVPAWADTLAACHAAVGEFEQAAQVLQKMVDLLEERQPDNRDIQMFVARVQQYRERKPFIESVAAK
jgi:TPR repeat protein